MDKIDRHRAVIMDIAMTAQVHGSKDVPLLHVGETICDDRHAEG